MSLLIIFWLVVFPRSGSGAEVDILLTGDAEYPGMLTLHGEKGQSGRLCVLAADAKGNVDSMFIDLLSGNLIPEGPFRVSKALPEEQWPTESFVKFGALRLVPISEGVAADRLSALEKVGLAVHGRDFFTLTSRMTKNPKMVRFMSDQLFEQLAATWGALRISNWDMGRLYDFYTHNLATLDQWRVRVVSVHLEKVKPVCEPLKVQRKPGGPLE